MADTQETIADIIAEMRRGTKLPGYWRSCDVNEILQYHADRIEAAHRREVATTKESLAVGNSGDCAKLREALKHIKDRLPHMLQYMRVHWEDASAGGYFDELMLVIDAALAAPPRNCDRPECATTKAAADVWRKEDGGKTAYHEWLLAPTTEKEGGNNADK